VSGEVIGQIGPGILTLLGVGEGDDETELEWMIPKILNLRIFEDEAGKMNRSLADLKGHHLIVSQFTLYGDTRKGNRPGFSSAAKPEFAFPLYQKAIALSRAMGIHTVEGQFQADMKVSLLNDGPVTLWLETPPRPNLKLVR
jgi:D-tyrosyl-tRNA(Tyr) deacylase